MSQREEFYTNIKEKEDWEVTEVTGESIFGGAVPEVPVWGRDPNSQGLFRTGDPLAVAGLGEGSGGGEPQEPGGSGGGEAPGAWVCPSHFSSWFASL